MSLYNTYTSTEYVPIILVLFATFLVEVGQLCFFWNAIVIIFKHTLVFLERISSFYLFPSVFYERIVKLLWNLIVRPELNNRIKQLNSVFIFY